MAEAEANLECAAEIPTEKTKVANTREECATGKTTKRTEIVTTTWNLLVELVKAMKDGIEIVSFKEKNMNESLSCHSNGA